MQVITHLCLFYFILTLICSCQLQKENIYLEHFKEVNALASISKVEPKNPDDYPDIQTFSNTNACLESYKNLRKEGYVMLGYALFDFEGKLSEGLAIETGKKIGAHKVLLARELGNSGVLNTLSSENDKGFQGAQIFEDLVHQSKDRKSFIETEHFHSVLFLVKRSVD